MRVMQLTTDLRFGGAERVVLELARGLKDRGAQCAVAGLTEGGESPARTRALLERCGVEVYSAGIERRQMVWRLAGLRRFVAAWRPDVLHCHLFHGNVAGALLRLAGLRRRLIWTYHSAPHRPHRNAFYRLLAGLPDCHVYVSQAVQGLRHAVAGRASRELVIYNGIEMAPFLAVEPQGGPVFGAMGRLDPGKGFDVLVRAFSRLCRADDEVALKIAGEGPERSALEDLIRQEGLAHRAALVGFVRNVPEFLSRVNTFVHPSHGEGFGLALLEAMAAGLPCIASRVGSLPEIGGDFVHWVRPGDVEQLCAQMRRLRRAPYSMDDVARQRSAVSRFSRQAMTEGYLRLYESLL